MCLLRFLVAAVMIAGAGATASGGDVVFAGGRVFDGERFVDRDLAVRDGVFVDRAAEGATVVSLAGSYVVPAYGDAHTHRFTADDEDAREMYLSRGFAYVFNLNGALDSRPRSAKTCNTPTTPEVRFATAGFTTAGGHPQPLYTFLDSMNKQNDPATVLDRIVGYNFFVTDTREQLDAAWPKVLSRRPDILKLFFLKTEAWDAGATGKSDGLRPEIAEEIGVRARTAGLRMAAHVETVRDARLAARVGVTLLAHMPGYGVQNDADTAPFTPTDEEIAEIAGSGMKMTPTLGLLYSKRGDDDGTQKVRAWKRGQVARWKAGGVPMVYGSDNYYDIESELREMIASKVWTNVEIVRLLTTETPRAIVPGRQVGELRTGYEATFTVLGHDPIVTPEKLFDVQRVIKFGKVIWELPPAEVAPAPGK